MGTTLFLTEDQISQIADLAIYLTLEEISSYFGINRETFLRMRKDHPDIDLQYQKGRSGKILRYAKQLEDKAFEDNVKGELTATIFFLKTRARWSEAKEESKVETIVETPEEKQARIEDTKLFLQWKKEREVAHD